MIIINFFFVSLFLFILNIIKYEIKTGTFTKETGIYSPRVQSV